MHKNSVIAMFDQHFQAENAIKQLQLAGIEMFAARFPAFNIGVIKCQPQQSHGQTHHI
jgi:hypothetical protein